MPIDAVLAEIAKRNYLDFFSPDTNKVQKPLSKTSIKHIAELMKNVIDYYGIQQSNLVIERFCQEYCASNFEGAVKEIITIPLLDMFLLTKLMKKKEVPKTTLGEYYSRYITGNRQNRKKTIARTLTEDLKINVCPYCNRNFINQKGGIEIDHYFSKSQYPLFSLSFYNLIPCCHSCNFSKLDKELAIEKLPNPYKISATKPPINFKAVLGESLNDFNVETNFSDTSYEYGYNEVLGIKDTYNRDSTYINDMINRIKIFNSLYPEMIQDIARTIGIKSTSDIRSLILGRNINTPINNLYPYYRLDNDLFKQFSEKKI